MLIIDAHLDLAWNALQWNRDLRVPVYTMRTLEISVPGKGRAQNTVALPDLRRGRVALSFATLLARATGHTAPHIDYGSPAQAYAIAQGQLAYYRALAADGLVTVIEDAAALDAHMARWQAWDATAAPDAVPDLPLGFVISMEGADPIREPAQLEAWVDAGLRALGPAHYGPCRYAGGTGTDLGFTDMGRELLREMARLNVLLDVTHLSDPAFWQALEWFDGPVLASHNNCRALVPQQRQFDDDQLRALIARDAVVGAAFDVWMLIPGFTRGDSNAAAQLATVVDHIDHVCQLAGNARHAAIGSDLDGGFGREQSPSDLDTIADLQRIPDLLAARGYGDADIAAIMHGNWVRLLRSAWA